MGKLISPCCAMQWRRSNDSPFPFEALKPPQPLTDGHDGGPEITYGDDGRSSTPQAWTVLALPTSTRHSYESIRHQHRTVVLLSHSLPGPEGQPLPLRADLTTTNPSTFYLYIHGFGLIFPRHPGLCCLRTACDDRRRA